MIQLNIEKIRELFPITSGYVNLNNAAESPMNLLAKNQLSKYLEFSENYPHVKPEARSEVRECLSYLFGGNPSDYSLVTSTGHGLGLVASGYNWSAGDNIVLPAKEHWNNSYPWIMQESKGVEIRFANINDSTQIDYDHLEQLVDENTQVITLAAVRFNSGLRVNLEKISKIARANDALLVVDGIQAVGAVPVNVIDERIDVLSAGGFKWLLGLPGTGFLYLNERARGRIKPAMPGMFSGKIQYDKIEPYNNSKKYETGTIAYPLFYSWIAGLKLLQDLGIDNIYNRIIMLTDRLIDGLKSKNVSILSPINNINERSGILIFSIGSIDDNYQLYQKLLDNKVIITYREGVLRVSPSFYNNTDDIDKLLSFI